MPQHPNPRDSRCCLRARRRRPSRKRAAEKGDELAPSHVAPSIAVGTFVTSSLPLIQPQADGRDRPRADAAPALAPHRLSWERLLGRILVGRLLPCLEHRGGFLGDGGSLEEAGVL